MQQVIPIFKNGSRLLCTNYRTISILSNISKIFDKVIHSRLNFFLEQHNHLYHTNLVFVNIKIYFDFKKVNLDLKNLFQWLKTNKLSLNATKTELLSTQVPKKSDCSLKFILDEKKINTNRHSKIPWCPLRWLFTITKKNKPRCN